MLNKFVQPLFLFIILLSSSSLNAASIEVFVSILPQQYFVQRIGGDQVNVNVMVKPGQSPATFEPSPKLMSLYSRADIFFTIGMPFEQVWIERVASLNKAVSIVDTNSGQNTLLPAHHHDKYEAHEKHKESSQKYPQFDPHTWLSPVLAIAQGKIILAELSRLSPENKDLFYNNYIRLESELNVLHKEISTRFSLVDKHDFITFHPAFSYFSRQYGLNQRAIEVGGKEPSAKQMSQIIAGIKNKNVSYLLIERQFNQQIPKTIADTIGAQLLLLDPLALDYITNMRDIAEKIHKALF